jgi:hypothetical protein
MTARQKNPQIAGSWSLKHGHTTKSQHYSPTYNSWRGMIDRCKPSQKYGQLGITVCQHWTVFANFLADMGERPKGHELDRKNPLGNYTKDNCRWLPKRLNRQYRRTTKLTVAKREEASRLRKQGETYQAIAIMLGVSGSCIKRYFTGKTWAPLLAKIPRPPAGAV